MNKIPRVYVLILQYNHSDETIRCLESLKASTYPNAKFVIIDNGSDAKHLNSTRLYLENNFAKVKKYELIINADNLGYTGGNNAGIDFAMENDADYILILNNDVEVALNFLEPLIQTAQSNPKIGIVQPIVSEEKGDAYAGGPIKWLNNTQKQISTEPNEFLLPDSSYIMGSAMMIKKDVIANIGKLDDRFFLYFEDVDFSKRAQRAGYRLAYSPNSHVIHNTSTSSLKLGHPTLHRYHYRNAMLFNHKHGPWYVRTLLPVWGVWVAMKQWVKLILGKHPDVSVGILNGVNDYRLKKFGKI